MEQPVTFKNRNGSRLVGMLYSPDRPVTQRVGVLVSVNAIKYRVGTFRLHVLLARKVCELGYYVFTFDPEGIGDSEGPFDNKLLSEHYYDIQTGKYSDDLTDAMNYFVAEAQIDRLVLFGLCGGAISVQMSGANDSRVQGLILLNLPVLVEDLKRQGRPDNAAKIVSSASAKTLLKHKVQRLIEMNFWRRLLRFEVDLREEGRLVRRSLLVLVRRVGLKVRSVTSHGTKAQNNLRETASSHRLFNMHFERAFLRSMELRQRTLFMFAELDPWTAIFNNEFRDRVLGPGNPYEANYTIEVMEAANHIFSSTDSQRELERRLSSWLLQHFPVSNSSTARA
ncbi:MAG: alpha/beta fold hydrolase [Pseudomonadota bacterium]